MTEQKPEVTEASTEQKTNNHLVARAGATVGVLAVKYVADSYLQPAIANEQGKLSTAQLQDTNAAGQIAAMNTIVPIASGAEFLLTGAALIAIWWKPVTKLITNRKNHTSAIVALALAAGASVGGSLLTPPNANAGKSGVDNPEYVSIGTNETAFAIPLQGANRTNQAEFMSEQYLRDNKVATKLFQIPHQHLNQWGSLTGIWVPATRLLVVDRTPFVQDWQDGSGGTSGGNQGFHMQTADGIALSFGLVVSASVKEEDAAKFVYNFGTDPITGEDPTYASVVHGRSLSEVMDTKVRGFVQAALSVEYGGLTADQAMAQKATIMTKVEQAAIAFFSAKGITIETVGYSTSPKFDDPTIQRAVNDLYANIKKAQALNEMASALPVQERQAEIAQIQATADATKILAGKWNGDVKVPQTYVGGGGGSVYLTSPTGMGSLLAYSRAAAAPAPK